ncbi:TadE/TadG family type IV pilus assembly protein [Qipengyuania soli]|uniref:Pilus assembly protein n=1 Tax=Qipengyuania soli TaxID=2782568 RepID=A0A7S8F418_9SPHN|nr:TadE/TadG family type IV pilus assembly protein [Qipengyuania soli]QPD00056.1 pilus assembly protein [Qipengyuania soli]
MRALFAHLRHDVRGSTVVEFAILAPVIFGMIFGVIQVGSAMQSYNAMRGIASDTARYAVIEYQKKNEVTDAALETYARGIATKAPYLLQSSFAATVTPVAASRVDGTFEKTLVVTYTPPSYMPIIPITPPQLKFTRSIFVIDE